MKKGSSSLIEFCPKIIGYTQLLPSSVNIVPNLVNIGVDQYHHLPYF
jgi:hypothetical protein